MRRSSPLVWVPPLAVGLAAAAGGELAAGLLLYSARGFLQALTLILVVELAALGAGLWSAPLQPGPAWEPVRRRWLLVLVSYTVAAATAVGWSALGGLSSAAVLRGVGLALLAALPLYASGTLLGAMSAVAPDDPFPSTVGAAATLGAAAGAALTGFMGPRLPPVSTYLGTLVVLSAASLVHGRALDRRTRVRTLVTRPSAGGTVRVEERVHGQLRRREVVLLEAGALRGGCDDAGAPVRRWETGAARLLVEQGPPARVLVIGAGASALPSLLPAGIDVQVADPNPVVAELAREHFPLSGRVETPSTGPCDLRDAVLPRGPWDAVVLDAAAWGGRAPVPRLPVRTLDALGRALEPGGLLVMGGVRLDEDGASSALEGATAAASAAGFAPALAYAPVGAGGDAAGTGARNGGRPDEEAGDDGLLVLRRAQAPGSPPRPPEGWRSLGPVA